ncbi:hypothetical protein EGY31_34785 [Burkholderia multivorans]|nr:hypothetical protein EGY31_34785 [Burkholderia multivorans]
MPQRQPCCPMNVAGMSLQLRHLSAGLHRDRAATTEPDFPTVAMASAEFSNHTQIFFSAVIKMVLTAPTDPL